jgi:hypothetical protein
MTARSPRQNHNPRQAPRAELNLQNQRFKKDAAYREAKALLHLATILGVGVASNGIDVLTVSTKRTPFELGRWLHDELAKRSRAVSEIIEQGNAARTGAPS